ncbi:MAG TPA: alpha/beta hydrolase [Streptosporangiaceae bacterium]|nr:alpha/beta hydrolase [Streptosporangiaceae bacterium]
MDNVARTRQRVLAIFLPVTAVLYISAEALSPKGTDQVISTTATALKVLPILAKHPAQLYLAGALALLGLGGLAVSYAAIAALVRNRGSALATVAALIGGLGAFCEAITNVLVYPNLAAAAAATAHLRPGRRPADFGEYRDQVVASLRRPGYAKAFSRTTRTSHDPAEARLADVTAPVLVVMGEQDPDFRDPRAEADWIARALGGRVVMVPEAGHYPQSQRPGITTGAVLRFLESVQGRA